MRRGGQVVAATGITARARGGAAAGGSPNQCSCVSKLTANGLGGGGKDGDCIFGSGEAL
jgi:hypothetical protein